VNTKAKDYSLYSGERYPSLDQNLIGADHLARYEYIANSYKNSNEKIFGADIFCGSGYGSRLLANKINGFILAIDGSEEAISVASSKVNLSNLIFASKLFPFNLPDRAFDFVCSLESIEHIKDGEAFFYVLEKSLKKNGKLFLSAPNEEVMPYDGYKWHHKHYLVSEIRNFAKKYGLIEKAAFSTSCCIYKEGKAVQFYPYQMNNNVLLNITAGDTLFFEFEKKI
jgi:2-polyprenyl-3-methyl-5-hydroxy-6-metoxy-1,4-benzoquinol methylase